VKRIAVLVATSLLLVGCTSVTTTTPVTKSASEIPSPSSWSNAASFAGAALANNWDRAEKYVSEGSPAAKYLVHQRAAHEASASAGGSINTVDQDKIEYDEAARTVTFSQGGTDTVWGHFAFDGAGLVTSWLTNDQGTTLAERLWTETPKANNPAAEIRVISAYRNETDLWIVLDVHSKGSSVSTQDSDLTYVGADKRQRDASRCQGPDEIRKGNSGYMLVAFTGANLGGTLYFKIRDSDYDSRGTLKLAIR
jgi:hypothetical protein